MNELERKTIAEAVQGVLRHDARNKVGAIRNAAFFLRKKTEKTELWTQPRVADFFQLIEDQLKELEIVLGDRDHDSGIISAPPSIPVTNVAGCMRAAAEGRPQVVLRVDEQLTAGIDSAELILALKCVLENAVEASRPEGTITVTAVRGEDGAIALQVEDSGPGFSPERIARPATPLAGTWPGHAGVGLSVAWRLMRNAGGELTVRNAAAGGGVVELRLRAPEQSPA